jgi:hypothetical protein
VLKLGIAAPALTSLASAATFAPPLPDELALELAPTPALVEAAGLAAAGLLELELDEQAASSSAAPTAVIPNATRSARGWGLSCLSAGLKRFMRPRIYHTGFDRTTSGVRFDPAGKIVNSRPVVIASRSGDYRQTLIRRRRMLSPRHIVTRQTERVFKE